MLQMPEYNFIYGCNIHGCGYAQMPHPNPNLKSCSKCCKMPKSSILFLGVTFMVVDMLKCPTPTLTLKVVPNVAKCLDMTLHFGCDMLGCGYAENPPPKCENSDFHVSI